MLVLSYFKLGVDGKFRLTEYDVRLATEYYKNENIECHVEFSAMVSMLSSKSGLLMTAGKLRKKYGR